MAVLNPFQLLEINIISAQDLEVVSKKMKTYAKAWVHPKRKLSSRVDAEGHNNPTWNDKFVFRVDEEFLHQDTSAVMIEIYGMHWFRDKLVGTVHVLVGNLIPPMRPHHHNHHIGMRFVALQVRRPSGRPQGILNIGVTLLDSSMRSMPLYTQLSTSAVGYRAFMGEEDPPKINHHSNDNNNIVKENNQPTVKPILRRTKSERSERVTFDSVSIAGKSSIIGIPRKKGTAPSKGSSILSISEFGDPFMTKKGKASSVISGAELGEKPKRKGQKGKASSVLSDSIISKDSTTLNQAKNEKPNLKGQESDQKAVVVCEVNASPTNKAIDEKSVTKSNGVGVVGLPPKETQKVTGRPVPRINGYEYGGPKGLRGNGKFVLGGPMKANSIWSDSEVGPSPSEVAAAMAEKKYPLDEDNRSSVLDGWSLDESVEGLRSKLERWRTELPPLYDRGYGSSIQSSTTQPSRRHKSGGTGMFSCFGNICGYECQCICGKPPGRQRGRSHSPSIGSRSFL